MYKKDKYDLIFRISVAIALIAVVAAILIAGMITDVLDPYVIAIIVLMTLYMVNGIIRY